MSLWVHRLLAHLVGAGLMVLGWFTSINYVGLERFNQDKTLISNWTLFGLALIFIGAYLPEVWLYFAKKDKEREAQKAAEAQAKAEAEARKAAEQAAKEAPPVAPPAEPA